MTPQELERLGKKKTEESTSFKVDTSHPDYQKTKQEVLSMLRKKVDEKLYKKVQQKSKKTARKASKDWHLGEGGLHLRKVLREIMKKEQ